MEKLVFCPSCGAEFAGPVAADDGDVFFCGQCGRKHYRQFPACVIAAVLDEQRRVLLLRQNQISPTNHVLVAGHVNYGETAEAAVAREIHEETGQQVGRVEYLRSYVHREKGLLMLGFIAFVEARPITVSGEVDSIDWFALNEAPRLLRAGSIGRKHLLLAIERLAAWPTAGDVPARAWPEGTGERPDHGR